MVKETFVENTYAEAFEGVYCRIIVTADDDETLSKAALHATATPSIVIGRVEGGIEKWLSEKATPDNRKGVVLQFWGGIDPKKPFSESLKKFEIELSYRIRQDILVKPFTAVFDALTNALGKIDMMERVGHCGDGYEWVERRYGREIIVVPIMVPDFLIERFLGYARGVMGANFWIMCKTKEAVKEAGAKALEAIHTVEGVVTPFDVCSAGSKPETRYPWIGPTTNHLYCPSLKKRLGKESKVPEDVKYIPEIVINGVSLEAVKRAMKAGVEAALTIKSVVGISAGNYGGKLGDYKIYLRELFP
ncbi:MAG: formylmethanofuran--tetrahydromethanopterin N-formyltransferase [Candidatus Bathyarchaeota archaeon]|nr:formylmethanofuran--tetrahydromethanopterin N-formyltransferase [Candidatus Bathyarchaeota archaeon A05DMB-3]MDH7606258.1 formylmethanofuran--tetrahydromethanopterin N-formyltransferase [Candidatus Bathyarchaeota archaeon]